MLPLGNVNVRPRTISFSLPSLSATNSGIEVPWFSPTLSLTFAVPGVYSAHGKSLIERSMALASSRRGSMLSCCAAIDIGVDIGQ